MIRWTQKQYDSITVNCQYSIGVKNVDPGIGALALLFTSCMTLSKLLKPSCPSFLICETGMIVMFI